MKLGEHISHFNCLGKRYQSSNLLTNFHDFLDSHQFCHRFSRGEDIFHFCFEFLKYATADEYSLAYHRREASKASSVVDEELSSSVLATYKNGTWFENSMMRWVHIALWCFLTKFVLQLWPFAWLVIIRADLCWILPIGCPDLQM